MLVRCLLVLSIAFAATGDHSTRAATWSEPPKEEQSRRPAPPIPSVEDARKNASNRVGATGSRAQLAEEAIQKAKNVLSLDDAVQNTQIASAVRVTELSDEWFFASLVTADSPAWQVQLATAGFRLDPSTKEPSAEARTFTVVIRCADGTVLGLRTEWPTVEGEVLQVRALPHDRYQQELLREGEEWIGPAESVAANLASVLDSIKSKGGVDYREAEQLVVNIIERKHHFDGRSVCWSVEGRRRMRNGSVVFGLDARGAGRTKKVSYARSIVDDATLNWLRTTTSPRPILEDETGVHEPSAEP